MDNRLVSIDGATQKTGISYFCNGNYVSHFLLDYSKEKNIENRFESMSKGIWRILDEIRPNIIYIEETYMANNAKTMRILTRIQGIVYAWCMNNECEFNTITPKAWRKILGFQQGNKTERKKLKEQSINYVLNTYGINTTDDEADSICISDAVIKMLS